jgi:hypothetical protein
LAAFVAAIMMTFALGGASSAQTAPSTTDVPTLIQQITDTLGDMSSQMSAAAPEDRAKLRQQAKELARQRRSLILQLANTSPAKAYRLLVPENVASKLPDTAQPYMESNTDQQGELQVMVQDFPTSHRTLYFLKTAKEKLQLHFAQNAPKDLHTGTRVRVRGKKIDGAIFLPTGELTTGTTSNASGGLQTLALASSNTFGAQSTVVALVNFQNLTSQPYTVEAARDMVFTQVSNFDKENSQNQTWLTGDVFGYYTLPMNATCNTDQIASLAKTAMTNAGVAVANYKRFVYIFPQLSDCGGWAGLGSIGGSPSQAWINGAMTLQVVGHEMGHNFGLYHSHSLICSGTTIGSSCSTGDYGDIFDTMGNVTSSHFNAFQKERLGWLNYSASLPITTVTSSGTYSLTPYSSTASGTRALKILKSTDASTGKKTYYYVEFRQPTGFDSGLSKYPSSTTGLIVHTGSESGGDTSFLLDMVPSSSSFTDAALQTGQTFTDSAANVTIKTVSASSSGASVSVTLGGSAPSCITANPTVTISPAATQYAAAGTALSYTVTVKSNDSTGCSTVNYSLSAQAPSGWSAGLSATTLSLAPGASGTANVSVTSPSSATSGVYSTVVKATNSAATTYSGSANANYGINAVAGLAISASPAALSIAQGGSGSSTLTVSGGANTTSLSLTGLPSGLTGSFSTTSIAGGSGSSLLTLRPAGTLAAGTYTATVNAFDGTKTASTNISVTVTAVTTSSDFTLSVSPTSVTMPQGTNGSATVRTALVGGFNSPVALSVSGMPFGVTASMYPGTIAAPGAGSSTLSFAASSSAAAGTYNLTVTASGGGKTHTAVFTLVITSSGGGTGTASQLIVNPGFESGQTGWSASTGVITYLSGEYAHAGTWKAWLSGYGYPSTRSMYQQVTVPSNALSATLSFWLHVDSYDTTGIAHDKLNVQVLDSYGRLLGTLASYSNGNAASGYQLRTFDLSAYRGRAVRLYFVATEDSSLRTNFVVDDVTLNVK